MREIVINDNEENQRLDKFMLKYFNKASKGFIYKMFRKKRIKYNNQKASGNEIIKKGDTLQLYISDETIDGFMQEKLIKKTKIDFSIIYEDENIIIVNKPTGLIVHPDKDNKENTLNDQLLYYLYEKGEYNAEKNSTFTPSICNRLDRNTSGIVIFGKTLPTVQALNNAIKNDLIDKFYLTIVKGVIEKEGRLKGYHIKDNSNKVKIYDKEIEGSKLVITDYEPLKAKNGYTLLKIKLITGKSHQIRASLFKAGYPIIGDRKYGDIKTNKLFNQNYNLDNQFLHAYKIVFKSNDKVLAYLNNKEFTAPLEENKNNIVKLLV